MRTARGVPVVCPSSQPLSTVKASVSFRAVVSALCPGARRAISRRTSSQSMTVPAGSPSSTAPMDGP